METPDILIVGAGIIGCSLARELARANVKGTVLDRGRVGAGASSVAAGLLSPGYGAGPAGPLAGLCQQGAALYESWVRELEGGGGDVGFRRAGLLHVWTDTGTLAQRMKEVAELALYGRRVEVLTREELLRREPALMPQVHGAAYHPD